MKSAYIVTYVDHKTDEAGNVTEVHVEYHPNSKSGSDTSGIKAKGTLHWVECTHAHDAEVRLYERLFNDPSPDGHKGQDFMEFLNPESLEVLDRGARWSLCWPLPSQVKPGSSHDWDISPQIRSTAKKASRCSTAP